jgi:hypothetical protein
MDPSTIETSSQDGNGGPISITGAGPLLISQSNITTSVLGTSNGNGGDITINVPVIALDTGAIQANTFAPLASGGTVIINAQALVPSYQSFVLGGSAIAFDPTSTGLNVVQAAAPDGVSGALSVTVPTLDLGNALLGLTGRPSAPAALGRGLCGFSRGSSLAITGLGGVAPSAYDPLWIDPEQAWHQAAAHAAYDPAAHVRQSAASVRSSSSPADDRREPQSCPGLPRAVAAARRRDGARERARRASRAGGPVSIAVGVEPGRWRELTAPLARFESNASHFGAIGHCV